MKKRIIQALCVLCFGSMLCVSPLGESRSNTQIEETKDNLQIILQSNKTDIVMLPGNNGELMGIYNQQYITENKIQEAQDKIDQIQAVDNMDYFIQYKQIQEEYSEWLDADETIYDYFNEYELELFFRIVETEVRGDEYFNEKVNVASVILNRLEHESFPCNLTDVLTQYPQFSSYTSGAYQNVTVTETTILACEYAFQFGDTTNGALYFDSTDGHSWADKNREFIFKDSVGHSFYK